MRNIRTFSVLLPKAQNSLLSILMITAVGLGGCTDQPSDEQLEVWRAEAIARNEKIMADNAKNTQPKEWNLVIQGETSTGKTETLNWQQLQSIATTNLKTADPNYILQPDQVFDFRGIPVSTLLKKYGYQPNVTEVTFMAYNSYQVTVDLYDLLKYPIILAIANDGKPISRAQGGPIYLVFPHSQYPHLQQQYPESFWIFYVSNIVVGTEPARLKVGKQELNLADLEKLPQITVTETVGYRSGWPSGKVPLHGVRLRDILTVNAPDLLSKEIVVQGKTTTYQNNLNSVILTANDIKKCDIFLATKWGDEKKNIPARMGGPLTLAFGSDCQTKTNGLRWVNFVEELVIKP
ncbi:molybdopterin-dependent oxidoreductase [Nostoc sp. CMAA1605]|uniref:molybdopterin-dependent oxidoreductase n=1 Tax=Nostoc sp. CMAA1605 TaxID=2055159 RepID=UPI001F3C220B|nr:molybdopterin-dependent oxidoreductase [Nostoc sp. CMAA1605]MCF4970473.1 molybdopterin-binding protein [Nostoc sp. CMAA1605]